jgi:hypothetical protein
MEEFYILRYLQMSAHHSMGRRLLQTGEHG